jgi:hypothetical protein
VVGILRRAQRLRIISVFVDLTLSTLLSFLLLLFLLGFAVLFAPTVVSILYRFVAISISTNNMVSGRDGAMVHKKIGSNAWYVKKIANRVERLVRKKNRFLGEENRWYEPRAHLSLNFALNPR